VGRIVKPALALSLVLTMFLGGTALAAKTYGTSLTLSANHTSIHHGQSVRFSGTLSSKFGKCYKFRTVTLYRNGDAVGSRTTSSTGDFSFSRQPSQTRTWQVKFAGKTGGTHPHQWVCKASSSHEVQVRVTG
jgi:hypothetical protein